MTVSKKKEVCVQEPIAADRVAKTFSGFSAAMDILSRSKKALEDSCKRRPYCECIRLARTTREAGSSFNNWRTQTVIRAC